MMKKALFMLAMLICILAGCSGGGNDEPINPTPKPEEVKAEITLDSSIVSNGLSFGVASGEQIVSFSANTNWTLSVASTTSGATWCKASATSGSKGNATVKFTIDENTSYDDRSVSVTIKAGTASKTFTITQKGADALLVTTNKYEVAQEGGKIEVEVKANINYELAISETAKDWISESNSRALTTSKHTFEIALNEESEKREGEITFKSGNKVETVKVYQAGGAIILLSQNEFTVSDAGETISVDVKSNIEYGVQMPDVDWITDEASSRGMSSHTLKYVILPNEDYDNRSAEIIFYDKNSDLMDTLKVIQVQKDAIILSKGHYKIEQQGGIIETIIKANIEYNIDISDKAKSWIKESYSRSLTENKHIFEISFNGEYENRIGEIFITSKNKTQAIQVHQNGGPILNLSNKIYSVGYKGDTIAVDVKSNVDYKVKMPNISWVTNYTDSRSLSNKTLKYIVKPNNDSEQRNTEIIFYLDDSHISDTIYITQLAKTKFITSEKNIEASWVGSPFTVEINENIEFPYNIEIKDDWVHWNEMSKGRVDFSIDYNNKINSSRSTSIIFRSKDKEYIDTLTVFQKAKGGFLYSYLYNKYGNYFMGLDTLTVNFTINGLDISWLRQMMGGYEFYDKGKLRNLNLSDATIIYSSEKRGFLNSDRRNETRKYVTGDNLVSNFERCSYITNIILPNSAKIIGREAFYECERLENVVFGTGIQEIRDYAFKNCYSLKNINLSDNVITLGKNLFEGCKLEHVTLGNKIESIGDYAFYDSRLIKIDIPDNVISIGENAFVRCWGLSVKLSRNLKQIGNSAFNGCGISELILPDKLITIGNEAFSNNDFVEISIPNSVTTVGKDAFYRCLKLTSAKIGNGMVHIADGIFSTCYELKHVIMPDNVTSIGNRSFYDCKKLNDIILPNSITSIGNQGFANCTTLKNIQLNNIEHIGEAAFQNCMSLQKDLKLNNISSIGESAFSNCISLENVVIGKNLKEISARAFSGCKNLKKVILGENVTKIGGGAFSNTIIESFYIYAPKPPKVSGAFDQSWSWGQDSLRILYVPKGTLNAYKSSEWRNYFDGINEMD